MKAKLIINDKELEVEISEEELKKLEAKSKKTGYEKPFIGEQYCYVDSFGEIMYRHLSDNSGNDEKLLDGANCYSDVEVAKNNARADKLMRQLRRFAVKHRKKEIDYVNDYWCEIYYDHHDKCMIVEDVNCSKFLGTICFDSASTAQLAIDTFRDELIWYFTEYKDSL